MCSRAVDTTNGVISQVQADFADSRDSGHLPSLLAQLQQRFHAMGLYVHDVFAQRATVCGCCSPNNQLGVLLPKERIYTLCPPSADFTVYTGSSS
ncbi:hypothetical protein [Hymenobacter volaticus]|uniref:Uncharacterized protein n=1 Tax=Hymenobacter volaticus TaxID=2932254 RepID=A0ABY4GFT2_9BACT|nr:hypothetical protein [Hymenobacter volaticus]UOQ69349.1 hypothetical protein MUN86_27015 [Hymenobacter volaticus]